MTRSSKDAKTRTFRAGEWLGADIGATGPVPLVEPHFSRNVDNATSGFESLLVCKANQRLGFRLTDTRFVRRLRPMNHIDLATFRADCLASRETEYGQYGRERL
ncbi:hypothetical protein [Phyllobacterium endophyticum]|uniref:Uncharacterized protein n=1 Tax=Phyllobacterium endophyticum TaxID=1149773 RepID=A0A2P7AZU7_9HYPH|nr:hypothetical protein [Phyllobacterium endophyticum]MBB3235619.1 hypothetical protein [Phyllobacterium endophyticum]PSH59755.1 hypothetical protein CU100_03040 [Phyllobacterium endophyticum]TXR48031.1 hypothetical protein FVA77_17180 [Phyllobacterium endophyticum]